MAFATPVSQQLQHPPAEIVRQLLIAMGQATDPDANPGAAWPAYKGARPSPTKYAVAPVPDNVIFVTTTLGQDQGRTQPDGSVMAHFGIQLLVRGEDDVVTPNKTLLLRSWMETGVYGALITLLNPAGQPVTYVIPCFSGIGQVLELGRDRPDTGLYLCSVNAVVAIQVAAHS